jgi:hypothetical protein
MKHDPGSRIVTLPFYELIFSSFPRRQKTQFFAANLCAFIPTVVGTSHFTSSTVTTNSTPYDTVNINININLNMTKSKSNENTFYYEETTAMATAVAVPMGPQASMDMSANQSRMASASAPSEPTTLQIVTLPVGLTLDKLGIEIAGSSPPVITNVVSDSPIYGLVHIGQYCHGILLPQVEIVHFSEAAHLNELIQANYQHPRDLLVGDTPFFIDPCLQGAIPSGYSTSNGALYTSGALYKHTLPTTTTTTDLDVQFHGFPPAIQAVSPHSPCAGRLHPHLTVECLLVPGQQVFSLRSGAFTSAKLVERLNNSSQIPGRILVVKDGVVHSQKGKSSAFDWGGTFTNQSGWGLKRMLGVGKKH